MRCIIYSPHWLRTILSFGCQESILYTYTGVGLSALLVSDEQGNAKALTSGTGDRTGSTLSCIYKHWNINLAMRMPDGYIIFCYVHP